MILASTMMVADRNASALSKRMVLLGTGMMVAGGLILNFAGHVEQSRNTLKQALENEGRDFGAWQDTIDKAIAKGKQWGHNQSQVMDSLQTLSRIVKDQKQLTEAYAIAEDVAVARGLKLGQATDLVTRAMAGNSRALRALGITETLMADPAKKYAAAHEALRRAIEQTANASANLRDAEQRYQTQLEASKNSVDQVAQAEKELDRTRVRAAEGLADAEQRLSDIRAIQAAQREKRQQDSKADTAAQEKLAQASERVLSAQMRMATAQGGGIADAQKQLRLAIDQQREALDKQAQAQRDAARGGDQEQQLRDQFELRDAIQAVDRARRTGLQEVEDAEGRVDQAQKDAYVATLRLRDAHLAVGRAERSLADAEQKQHEAWKRAHDAKIAMVTQQQHVLDLLKGKVNGLADAHSKGLLGAIRRTFADWEDKLGNVGNTMGGTLLTVGLLVSSLGRVSKVLGGAGGAAGAAEEGTVAGGIAAASAETGGLAAAIALLAPELLVLAGAAGILWAGWSLLPKDWKKDMKENTDNLFKGLTDGISFNVPSLMDKWNEALNGMKSSMNSIWRFGSPSKVMHQYGRWMMEGLADGIGQNQHRPVGQIVAASHAMKNATAANWAHQGFTGNGTVGGIERAITINVAGHVLTEKELIRRVRDGLVEMGVNQGGVTI